MMHMSFKKELNNKVTKIPLKIKKIKVVDQWCLVLFIFLHTVKYIFTF